MAARRTIWDLKAEGGPAQVTMFAYAAAEALANDPERYSVEKPEGDEEDAGAKAPGAKPKKK